MKYLRMEYLPGLFDLVYADNHGAVYAAKSPLPRHCMTTLHVSLSGRYYENGMAKSAGACNIYCYR